MIKTSILTNLARILVLVDKYDDGHGRTEVREPRRGEAPGRRRARRGCALNGRSRGTHYNGWRGGKGSRPGVSEA